MAVWNLTLNTSKTEVSFSIPVTSSPVPAILSQSSTQFTLKSDLDLFLPYPVLLLFSKFSCIYFLPPASHCHQLVSILLSSARLLNSHLLSSLTPSFKLVSKFKRPGWHTGLQNLTKRQRWYLNIQKSDWQGRYSREWNQRGKLKLRTRGRACTMNLRGKSRDGRQPEPKLESMGRMVHKPSWRIYPTSSKELDKLRQDKKHGWIASSKNGAWRWAKNALNISCVAPELAPAREDIGTQQVIDMDSFYNCHFIKWLVDWYIWVRKI